MLQVVAAFFRDHDHFLICRRPQEKNCGGAWEFPGGKIEPGETAAQALAREISEELAVCPIVSPTPIAAVEHDYGKFAIHLMLHACTLPEGAVIRLREHTACEWITEEEIGNYAFCPADSKLLCVLFPDIF